MDRFDYLGRQLIGKIEEDGPTLNCYQPEEFEAYISNEVESDKRLSMDAHMEGCLYCLKEFVEVRHLLSDFDEKVADPQSRAAIISVSPRAPKWWNSFGWSVGGAFAGALVTILIVNITASDQGGIFFTEEPIKLMGGATRDEKKMKISEKHKISELRETDVSHYKLLLNFQEFSLEFEEFLVTPDRGVAQKALNRLRGLDRLAFIVLSNNPRDGSQLFRVVVGAPKFLEIRAPKLLDK